jgi:ribosomal protein S18 acetylase RimI-like enzyme
MSKEEFEIYKRKMYEEYAKVLAENLLIPYEEALARAEDQIDTIWNEDIKKGKNYGYNVITGNNEHVGRIWVFVNYSYKKAFIYDIRIFPKYQKKGFAKSAIKELEETLKKENVKSLELNVFGNNKVAYNLYKNLGFHETHINLMKGFEKQRVVTLPKFLKFLLETLFLKSGYRIVAIEMRKNLK